MPMSAFDKSILDRFAKSLVAQTLVLEGAGWNIDDIHEECSRIVKAWMSTEDFKTTHTLLKDRSSFSAYDEYLFDKIEYIFNTLRTLVQTQDF